MRINDDSYPRKVDAGGSKKSDSGAHNSAALDRLNGVCKVPEPPAEGAWKAKQVNYRKEKSVKEPLKVATFNLAGGNKEHAPRFKSEGSDRLAKELRAGTDVVSAQEVSVGTFRGGADGKDGQKKPYDYNQEVMEDVFRQESGIKDIAQAERYSLGADGKPVLGKDGNPSYDPKAAVTVYEANGHRMTLSKERFDKEGNPIELDHKGEGLHDHPITVYTAKIDGQQPYTAVYGASHSYHSNETGQEAQYGNSVFLGRGQQLPRDPATGQIVPGAVQVEELGHDPSKESNGEYEYRTAVGVNFLTPQGQHASAISAHFTTDKDREGKKRAQASQAEALQRFAHRLSGGENVIIGGDFNTKKLPDSLDEFDAARRPWFTRNPGLDHLLFSPDVGPEKAHYRGHSGSDHEWLEDDIVL